jgi:hypothetical protein
MNRPGLDMYSVEWMNENATMVPPAFHALVCSICEAYMMGNADDPNLVWRLIVKGLKDLMPLVYDDYIPIEFNDDVCVCLKRIEGLRSTRGSKK